MGKRGETRVGDRFVGPASWIRDNWKLTLFGVGLAAFFIAVGLLQRNYLGQSAIAEEAEVVRFGAYATDEGTRPVVLVRTKNGAIEQLLVNRRTTRNCRVGSAIRLVRRGNLLVVDPRGCGTAEP